MCKCPNALKKGYDYNGDNEISEEEAECGELVDANKNGRIDPNEKRAFIRCLKHVTKAKYDYNGDGKVTRKEMSCGLQADANNDGILDPEEIAAFKKCLEAVDQEGGKNKMEYDFNGDHKIESNEKKFARLFDINGDGKLTHAELKRAKLAWKLAKAECKEHSAAKDKYYYDEYYEYGSGPATNRLLRAHNMWG